MGTLIRAHECTSSVVTSGRDCGTQDMRGQLS
jgi:hypothetical protein